MKKYVLAFTLMSSISFANDLTLISNGTSSGTNGQQIKIISEEAQKLGLSSEIKMTNQNCALSKLHWDNSKNTTLMLVAHGIDGLTDPDNKACYLNIRKDDIIFWLYSTPYAFCSAGNKTWKDFTQPNTKHSVVIHPENRSVDLFNYLSRKYKTTITTIKVNTSSIALIMAKADEIDFVFRTGITEFEHFKDKCIWSSFKTNLPAITDIVDTSINPYHFSANGYIIVKNVSDKDKIRLILKNALNSESMIKIHERRGYDNSIVDFSNNKEYLERLETLFSILY